MKFYNYYAYVNKLLIGIPVIGYDWKLPYVLGVTKANSLNNSSAIQLAGEAGVTIQFDEISQTPFYEYTESVLPIKHIVWFTDARSMNGMAELVTSYVRLLQNNELHSYFAAAYFIVFK